jgi:lipopolysaccharide heptosyltransferase I
LPEAEISWVVEQRSAEIIRSNPSVDDVIEVDTRSLRGGRPATDILRDAAKQVRGLRKKSYDVAIDFQGLLKSAVIAKISGAEKRFGFDRNGLREPSSRVFLTNTISVPERIHVIRKNLHLASAALGITVPDEGFEFPIATLPEHIDEADRLASAAGGNFALLNPAGGWVTKLWHAEKFGKLADRLWREEGLVPLITTGPTESAIEDEVRRNTTTDKAIFARPTLKGFYELAKRAAVYVGGDTGPTHLAVAAGAPVVGLFGPTEWWRNGSPISSDICVERTDIACRINCHRRTCSNWICMDIDVETVFEAVKLRMSATVGDERASSEMR